MAQVTVKFNVKANCQKAYICGSTSNLGAWDAKKAVEVKDGSVSKKFEEGTVVEFKVLAGKCWCKVEKGLNGEELANHSFVATKGQVVEVEVSNFAE
ncbi:MAG: hypothetical protein K6E20_06425 [Acholeplasmatales bacterium]|nr:hypothetical protein [Acholeplasmatales bacterium]